MSGTGEALPACTAGLDFVTEDLNPCFKGNKEFDSDSVALVAFKRGWLVQSRSPGTALSALSRVPKCHLRVSFTPLQGWTLCAGAFKASLSLLLLPLGRTGSKLGWLGGLVPPDGAATQARCARCHPRDGRGATPRTAPGRGEGATAPQLRRIQEMGRE